MMQEDVWVVADKPAMPGMRLRNAGEPDTAVSEG